MCKLEVAWGKESEDYSFPDHPMNSSRTILFAKSLKRLEDVTIVEPIAAREEDLLLFHTKRYVDFVKKASKMGTRYLDYGDTPAFPGVYEAALYTVGTTLYGLDRILENKVDHFFNPIGGLHHARRDGAGGFCVFNDAAVAISKCLEEYDRVAYIDIDAHHGDGVFYGFEEDERVIIGDVHEDGRFLYPGTGNSNETGRGRALGTKMNVPLAPGSKDVEFVRAFDSILTFTESFNPEFIFLQCGADGLKDDPITHLEYSRAHTYAAKKLHMLSHKKCGGRLLAMGGGGYNPVNVEKAWIAVTEELS